MTKMHQRLYLWARDASLCSRPYRAIDDADILSVFSKTRLPPQPPDEPGGLAAVLETP